MHFLLFTVRLHENDLTLVIPPPSFTLPLSPFLFSDFLVPSPSPFLFFFLLISFYDYLSLRLSFFSSFFPSPYILHPFRFFPSPSFFHPSPFFYLHPFFFFPDPPFLPLPLPFLSFILLSLFPFPPLHSLLLLLVSLPLPPISYSSFSSQLLAFPHFIMIYIFYQ